MDNLDPDVVFTDSGDIKSPSQSESYECLDRYCDIPKTCNGNHSYNNVAKRWRERKTPWHYWNGEFATTSDSKNRFDSVNGCDEVVNQPLKSPSLSPPFKSPSPVPHGPDADDDYDCDDFW
ncbi:hypothetical protein SOVF_079770 [Spinacia oleracea]|nr:hypothetical protein SOVF_079770 [Spinacia oleracea]